MDWHLCLSAVFWQIYDNIIPLMLARTFGLGDTVTGVIMAMDNVLAIVLLPVFGAISDKVNTRIGKRMPFIITGTVLAVTFMSFLPIADTAANLPLFVGALFGALISMGLYRSPSVALMPDLTPNRLRSKANAIINLLGAVGGVYSLIMIKLLVPAVEKPNYRNLFLSVSVLMVVAIVVLFFTINEKKVAARVAKEEEAYQAQLKETGTADEEVKTEAKAEADDGAEPVKKTVLTPEVKHSMIFMLASIFLWFTAYNAVTTAFSRYVVEVWKL